MEKAEFERIFIETINALRQQTFVPYDTGNLKFNAIKGIWISETTYRIYIDESVAPYMKFTQEAWGKGKNPNEGWFDKAVEFIALYIKQKLQEAFNQ